MNSANGNSSLLNELNKIQEAQGFISRSALEELAQREGISPSELFGFVTFFNSFRIHPKGKIHLNLCYGTACYIRGAKLIYERLVDEFKLDRHGLSEDGLLTVETVYCVGSCSCAPVVVHEDEHLGRMNIQRTLALVRELIQQTHEQDLIQQAGQGESEHDTVQPAIGQQSAIQNGAAIKEA